MKTDFKKLIMLASAALIMQSVAFQVLAADQFNHSPAPDAWSKARKESQEWLNHLRAKIEELKEEYDELRTQRHDHPESWTFEDNQQLSEVYADLKRAKAEFGQLKMTGMMPELESQARHEDVRARQNHLRVKIEELKDRYDELSTLRHNHPEDSTLDAQLSEVYADLKRAKAEHSQLLATPEYADNRKIDQLRMARRMPGTQSSNAE